MCCYNILFSSVFAHFSFCQLMKKKTYFTSSVPQWPPKLQTLNKCNKQTNESINLPEVKKCFPIITHFIYLTSLLYLIFTRNLNKSSV